MREPPPRSRVGSYQIFFYPPALNPRLLLGQHQFAVSVTGGGAAGLSPQSAPPVRSGKSLIRYPH